MIKVDLIEKVTLEQTLETDVGVIRTHISLKGTLGTGNRLTKV